MTNVRAIGIAGAVGFLGFAAGRWLAPDRVVEKTRIVERQETKKAEWQYSGASTASARTENTRVVIRYVRRPDGTEEREETRENGTTRRTEATSRTEQARIETRYVDRVVERERLVERSRAAWAVGLHAKSGVLAADGRGGRLVVPGMSISRRVAGPVWVSVSAEVDKTVGVGLRLEF